MTPHPLRAIVAILLVGLLSACTPSRGPAVPADLQDRAVVLGMPVARTWGDTFSAEFLGEIVRAATSEPALQPGAPSPVPPASYLAISGGGANGAYGAGLLCGWTAAGTRPEFKVVTGISTGALSAPFAFLGPDYDDELRAVYTTTRTKDIATDRGIILGALFDDALANSSPLRRMLEKYITVQLIEEIAREYARGRLLLIATTNLDASRPVIWNIGAIASSADPGALKLVQDILIASAAIPAAFPPVFIDVEADGKHFQEMHVDGGATAQLFLYPPSFALKAEAARTGIERERRAYIIRNSRLDPDWAAVERQTLSIAGRAIGALIQTQGQGDLYRVYLTSGRDGVDFSLAFIPRDFTAVPAEAFDPAFMQQLFDVGYNAALAGYPWSKAPPGFVEEPRP